MSDFKDDRAAFEAATTCEWKYDGDFHVTTSPNGDEPERQKAVAALIARMHSTYLPRMDEIETLRIVLGSIQRKCQKEFGGVACDDFKQGFSAAMESILHHTQGDPVPVDAYVVGERGTPYQLRLERRVKELEKENARCADLIRKMGNELSSVMNIITGRIVHEKGSAGE